MTIENALDVFLKADNLLTGYVGNRIYWMQAVQSTTMPYLVYQVITDSGDLFSFGNPSTSEAIIQLDFVGSKKSDKNAMLRVISMLRGFNGLMGGTGGVTIYSSFQSRASDTFNPDTNKYIFSVDFKIQYQY